MELDPEKRLWLPSRRSFFFLGAAAGVGALLPNMGKPVLAKFLHMDPLGARISEALIYLEPDTPPLVALLREAAKHPGVTCWLPSSTLMNAEFAWIPSKPVFDWVSGIPYPVEVLSRE